MTIESDHGTSLAVGDTVLCSPGGEVVPVYEKGTIRNLTQSEGVEEKGIRDYA
jgi:hypothetical protein